MAILRDDRYVQDALGRNLAGAQVWWCVPQPTTTDPLPPTPLATIYTDTTGTTPVTQPVLTDGFGHAIAYLDDSQLFTVVIQHPLFGQYPIILRDQSLGSGGGGNLSVFSGTPTGTIDGTNKNFIVVNGSTPLTEIPAQIEVWLNFPLIQGLGYSLAIVGGQLQVTFATAPQPATGGNPADALFAQGLLTA